MRKILSLFILISYLITSSYQTSYAAFIPIMRDSIVQKTLVIQHKTKKKRKKIRKRQLFRQGQKIVYKLKGSRKKYKGKITGFTNNEIIIKDKKGNYQTILLEDISKIRQKRSVGSSILKVLSVILTIIGIGALLALGGGCEGLACVVVIPLIIALITAGAIGIGGGLLLGGGAFLFGKSFYNLEKKWKAEIRMMKLKVKK